MRPTPPAEIQQHMYTRERRGMFRATEGYDTIAASKGLDASFIKKSLHPFCLYDAPTELSTSGERDESRYPESLHLYHTDQGVTVYGRSVFRTADFTGLRSTFFTHNYVIPADRSNEIVTNYASWFNASFTDSYDIESGSELPVLDSLPAGRPLNGFDSNLTPREKLAALKFDERTFKQLLFAVMLSASGKKKVYIALDVPIEQLSLYARELLVILFDCLPYAYRRTLGFMTFVKDLKSKRGIHLMFVEKGSLRSHDRNVEKEFTFDLVNGRVMNVEPELVNQPYLDYVWNTIDQPERLTSFFDYAEQMLADMDLVRQTAIASYHELCVYYQIEAGEYALYEMNKAAVLRGILEYLRPQGAFASKQRLGDLFVTLIEREFDMVKQGTALDPIIADCFKDFYRLSGGKQEGQIIALFIYAINQSLAAKDNERVSMLYHVIRKHPALSKVFFDTILNRGMGKLLFDPYIKEQFRLAERAGDVLDLVCEWGSQHMQVLSSESFSTMAQEALLDKLRQEQDPVTVVNAILEQLTCLPRTHWEDVEVADSQLIEMLAYQANLFLLTEIELESLSKDQLLKIGFLQQPDEVRAWARRFDEDVCAQAAMMLAGYQWLTLRDPDMSVFDGLSDAEIERLQKLGRNWLRSEVVPAQFERITLAFYRDIDEGMMEYGALLQYLHTYAADKEIVYQFLQWSETHTSFVRSRKPSPAYTAAIITYFKKYDREAFKKRANRKQYFEVQGSALKPVYDKARLELASPLRRLMVRNKKFVWGLMLVMVIAGGGVIGLQAAGVWDKEEPIEPPAAATPSGGTGDQTTPLNPDQPELTEKPVVYAEQVTAIIGGQAEEVTKLVFTFTDGEACGLFNPGSLTIVAADGTETLISNLELKRESACLVDRVADSTDSNTANQPSEQDEDTDNQEQTGTGPSSDSSSADDSEAVTPESTYVAYTLDEQLDLSAELKIKIGDMEYPVMDKPDAEDTDTGA